MCDLELAQVNLVQGQCVNLTLPGTKLELNIELNHTANTTAPGILQASTKVNVTPIKKDPASPFSIEFELRSSFKAPMNITSDEAFSESARYVLPFVQANLSQFCNLLGISPITLPLSVIPSASPVND